MKTVIWTLLGIIGFFYTLLVIKIIVNEFSTFKGPSSPIHEPILVAVYGIFFTILAFIIIGRRKR